MQTFYFKAKANADDVWHTDSIEAEDKAAALEFLHGEYGVTFDENGDQTNSDLIVLSLVSEREHKKLKDKRQKWVDKVHKESVEEMENDKIRRANEQANREAQQAQEEVERQANEKRLADELEKARKLSDALDADAKDNPES